MPRKITIEQKHYGNLEIDTSEKDVVQIWMHEKTESNVIHIENENIEWMIEILKSELKKRK